jgi:hypothetical protein
MIDKENGASWDVDWPPNLWQVRGMGINWPITQRKTLLSLLLFVAAVSLGAAPERTLYSATSNKDLKQRASRLVKNIRDLVNSYNKKDRDLLADYDKKNRPEIGTDDRKVIRDQWLRESDSVHDSTMRYYRDHYWSDAILLLDELYKRLPARLRRKDLLPIYQHPTNVLGLQTIANHLELTAKSLPES